MEFLIAAFGAALGGLLTYLTSRQLNRQSQREQRVFELQAEYYSERTTERRIRADLFTRRLGMSFKNLYEEALKPSGAISAEDYISISYIYHFWARVGKLNRSNLIRGRDIERLLGDEVLLWLGPASSFETILVNGVEDPSFSGWFDNIRSGMPRQMRRAAFPRRAGGPTSSPPSSQALQVAHAGP